MIERVKAEIFSLFLTFPIIVDAKKWRRNGGPKGGEMKGGMEAQVEACHRHERGERGVGYVMVLSNSQVGWFPPFQVLAYRHF